MTMEWSTYLKNAKKSCMVDNKLKRVRYDFDDGKIMVEEYNMDTYVVTRRAWKKSTKIGDQDQWEIELGDPEPTYNKEEGVIKESSTQPFLSKRLTRINIEWRVRNLPYSFDVYSISIDNDDKCIIVRTTNKKYFKKITVVDMVRLKLPLSKENLSYSHNFNTLIITYKKPKEMLEFEKGLIEEIKQMEPPNHGDNASCKPS
ncbi:unnamed protein product [Brassicogethes aeneus]|uniref:Protein DPCD n=1 Tax=Brassicogethes aeneus TaxID=1431903 RepID=A0A9P0ASC1_BRAAE|nr:unnamed protein product [Brassicogethes aeneus]